MRILLATVFSIAFATAHAQPADCQLGLEEIKAERYTTSIEPLSRCLRLDLPGPARAFVLRARAHSYGELKRWSAAAEDQQQSILLETPKDVWPHVMLGAYLREDKKYDAALKALEAALQFDEDGPGTGPGMAVHYHTAQTLHQVGRFRDAIEVMTKGIPKQPDYGYALYQRALSYEAIGDKEQAKRDLFRAVELIPKDGYEPEIAKKLKEYGFTVKVRSE
jgi:tetratricopeptide (TPR) repeat protein